MVVTQTTVPDRADVVTRQRATDAWLFFLFFNHALITKTLRGQPKGDLALGSDGVPHAPNRADLTQLAPLMQTRPRLKSRAVGDTRK